MIEATAIGLAAAFGAGLISFVSPCVLPLVPAYVSYVAGQPPRADRPGPDVRERLAALGLSAFFVLGFSSVFMALGASATQLGRLLLQYRYEANLIGGVIVIAFGLLMLGMTRACRGCSENSAFIRVSSADGPCRHSSSVLRSGSAGRRASARSSARSSP